MATTEAPYVVSHNFCAIRAESVDELLDRLREFNAADEIGDEIAAFRAAVAGTPLQNAVATVKHELGATEVTESAGPEVVHGKFGDKWTYGLSDAPDLPDGRGKYVLREWTDKSNKARKAFVDPSKGPKPFSPGAEEAKIIWK